MRPMRYVDAAQRILCPKAPDEDRYFAHAGTLLRDGCPWDEVGLYVRVSERDQDRRGSLYRQWADGCHWLLLRYGVPCVQVFPVVCSGYLLDDNPVLGAAIDWARRYNAPLVARDVTRFIRSRDYQSQTNTDAWPTETEFDQLAGMAAGVTLATLINPTAEPYSIRHYEQEAGHRLSPRGMGQSDRTLRSAAFSRLAYDLKTYRGFSHGDIAKLIQVESRSTVQDWVNAVRFF